VLTEFIVGYILPGRPVAMMAFKTCGYMTMYQALSFAQDLKLGHYMKVPPRTMFWSQTVATFWAALVQVSVMNWALGAIKDVCSATQANSFTCPQGRLFFNTAVIWGLIGPQRIFSPGQIYHSLYWFFLLGALLPLILYLIARRYPKSPVRYLLAPLIIGGTSWIPPATPLTFFTWGIVGFIFAYYIKNKYRGWWMHYNYITSAGLDVGLALCTILIFLTLTLTSTAPPKWWGNTITGTTLDFNSGLSVQKKLPEGQTFGPAKGTFH
jgi:OPT family small oligopeptide transporter